MKNYLEIAKFLLKLEKNAYKQAKKQNIDVSDKKAHDLVTNYDFAIEKSLIAGLNKKFPNIKIVSEEFNNSVKAEGTYFIIDPVDGTINFANKSEQWGVQVAYIENDEIKASAIFMPFIGEYIAGKGFGAFKNGKRFYVEEKDMKHCLLTSDCELDENIAIYKAFTDEIMGWRKSGAACLDHVYLAEGVYGIYIFNRCKLWDWMPGQLILLEAGCVMKDYKNVHVMANNEKVLKKTLAILKKIL